MFHFFFSENGTDCPCATTKVRLQAMCGGIPSSLEAILRFCCELCPTNITQVLTDALNKALSDLDLPADVITDQKHKPKRVKKQPTESQEPVPKQQAKPAVLKRECVTSKQKPDATRAVTGLKRQCPASNQSKRNVKQKPKATRPPRVVSKPRVDSVKSKAARPVRVVNKPCVDSVKSKATRPVRVVKHEHPKVKEKPKRISPAFLNIPPLEQKFEVEAIMAERKKAGKVEYFVKWRDYSSKSNTWEPVDGLHSCNDVITAFQSRTTSAVPSKIHRSKNNQDRDIDLGDFCVVVDEDRTWWIGRVEELTFEEGTEIVSNLAIHEYGNESYVVHTAKAKQMAAYKKEEFSQFTNGRPGVGFKKSMITIEVGALSDWGPRDTILTKNSTVRATVIRRLKIPLI